MNDCLEAFRAEVAGALGDPGPIEADGKIHRFKTADDRAGGRAGWYVFHADGLAAGAFGSWKAGDTRTWCAKPEAELSRAERAAWKRRMVEARAARDAEREREAAEARQRAEDAWSKAQAAGPDSHPYLIKKGVQAHGTRVAGGRLLVPACDLAGDLHSLQLIDGEGVKRFLPGGAVAGHCYRIGEVNGRALLAEGFATAATIREATGEAVVVAFNAGNLRPVAEALRAAHPLADLIVCADNDQFTDGNPGATKAAEAAEAARGRVVLPSFADLATRPTDFNDLGRLQGLDAVRVQILGPAGGDTPADAGPGRPRIRIVDGELARIVRESEAALLAAGGVYRRGGVPVHVRRVDDARPAGGVARALGTPMIAACSPELLVLRLASDAVFERYAARRKKWEPTNPPPYVGRYLVYKGEWTFPPLAGVVNAPTLRADGSILDVEGYDPATGLLVDFDGVAFPPVPPAPTPGEARAALDRLAELVAEFPFADPAGDDGRVSRAVLLAAMLTAPVRRSLPTAPLFLIDAPKPGTGKTFAAELVAQLATGRPPAVMAHAVDGAEERKRLLSSLLAGDGVTLIDNVEAVLRSDVLCAVLTAATYRDRLLGQNVNATVPTATSWIANGNNVTVQGDLTRRVLLCRMDAGIETPDARTFRGNPRAVLEARRPELLVDALAVIRAHHVAGRPGCELAPFGSFEAWSGWIRAALVWLGEADPLGNRPALEANDPEREALRNLLTAWDVEYGESTVLAGELARRHADWAKAADHADPLAEALDGIPHAPRGGLTARALGQYLQRVRDKVEAGLRLRRSGTYHSTALWRVEPAGGGNGGF